jgi:hypothetical protein
MRGEVRRQLIQAYRTGTCDTANGYRRSIMAIFTGSDGLARQHVNGWLGEILSGPVFDELGRVMSNDALVVEGLIRSSLAQRSLRSFGMAPGAANAFSFALFDHDMPDAKTFYNVGAIGQFVGSGGKIKGVQTADVGNATTSAVPEDWPPQRDTYFKAVGNIVKNTMDAYVGYNINPFLIAARGMEHPGLFRELMSDTPDIRLFFPEETKFGPYKDNSGGIDRGFELAAEGELNNNAPVPEERMPDSEPEDEGNSEYKDGIIGGGFTPQMWMLKNRIDAEKKRAEEGIPKSPEVDEGVPPSSEGSSPVPPQKVIPPSIANSKETVSRTPGAEPAAAGADQNRLNLKESEKDFLSPRPKVDNQSPQAPVSGITRAGKAFTKKGGQIILENNRQKYQGVTRCEKCGVQTVPGERHRRGVTPPNNETHKDHVISRSKGGAGLPENGQVLCRACNLDKSDK